MKKRATMATVAAVLMLAGTAQAQQTFDPGTLGAPACANSGDNTATMLDWISCRGSFQGNTNEIGIGTYLNAQFGGTFTALGSSADGGFGPFSNNPGGTDGTLGFDGALNGTFVLALKASNRMSFYLFAGNGQTSVKFNTLGVSLNAQDIPNGLSHAALWGGQGATITNVVPEPSTYLLVASGLAALGFVSRRRRHA